MSIATAVRRLADAGCVYAEEEAAVLVEASRSPEDLEAMLARRAAGDPLEYVVGWSEFRGIRLVVDEGTFVPRARTGLLVDEAASLVRCRAGEGRTVTVVDLCCGVGAVGAALLKEVRGLRVHAADIDPRAVACARRNVEPWGGAVHQGDLFAALPRRLRRRVDVLVASPPYVPSGQIRLLAAEAREFEPSVALDGGPAGLDVVDRIGRGARQWLSPDGCLALEVAASQVDHVALLLEDLGYATRPVTSAESGSAVVTGRLMP